MIGIYKITSPNGAVYIGQSWVLEERIKSYMYKKCVGQYKIHRSIVKYGWKNHIWEIAHILPLDVTQEILDRYETLYWQSYKDCGIEMLNLKEPGKGGRHSEETKAKMKEAKKINPGGPKVGYKHTEEAKKKMSISRLGKPSSKKGTHLLKPVKTLATGRKPYSPESIERYRLSSIGRIVSEETKAKLRGPRSEERKKNQSNAIKLWWANRKILNY